MAGDWIKVEVATLDKPEVIRMAELLNIKRDEMLGILLRFWAWLDRSTGNGLVTHMSRIGIDEVMRVAGFGAALECVGWGKFDDAAVTLTVPNFEKHNGNPAKTRALGRDRKRMHDLKTRNGSVTLNALPEKRREEIKEVKEKALGFERFWKTWPPSDRKGSKNKCLGVWIDKKLEPRTDEICGHVEAMKASRKWSDPQFIEAPLVYLNQSRWDGAELPAAQPRRLAI